MPSPRPIIIFLALTCALSGGCYALLLGPTPNPIFGLGLIMSPALAAVITQLSSARRIWQGGWSPGPLRYLLAGYGLPLGYGLVVYVLVWISGIGGFSPQALAQQVADPGQLPTAAPALFVMSYSLKAATLGMAMSCLTALGEEIGWRGFLVPELAKRYSFTGAALISGIVWAVWHYPAILLLDGQTAGAPRWFGLLCFTVLVMGLSVVLAWLRLRSGSVWPAVLLHASHNVWIQTVLNPLTRKTALTPYVIDEAGAGLALAAVVLAALVWRRRGALPRPAA